MGRFQSVPVTPNQLTVAGLSLNGAAAILIYREHFVWATVAFVSGSVFDILDGALARSHGKLTPFGGFLDSTTDRISEGLILGSIALVLAAAGQDLGAGERVRGAGRLLPGELHPRQGRSHRPEM